MRSQLKLRAAWNLGIFDQNYWLKIPKLLAVPYYWAKPLSSRSLILWSDPRISSGSIRRFTRASSGFLLETAFREIAVKTHGRVEFRDFWPELLVKNPETVSGLILLSKTAFCKIADPLIWAGNKTRRDERSIRFGEETRSILSADAVCKMWFERWSKKHTVIPPNLCTVCLHYCTCCR